MDYEELTDQEKRIYEQIYALQYNKHSSAYHAIREAEKAIYDLRYEKRKSR